MTTQHRNQATFLARVTEAVQRVPLSGPAVRLTMGMLIFLDAVSCRVETVLDVAVWSSPLIRRHRVDPGVCPVMASLNPCSLAPYHILNSSRQLLSVQSGRGLAGSCGDKMETAVNMFRYSRVQLFGRLSWLSAIVGFLQKSR